MDRRKFVRDVSGTACAAGIISTGLSAFVPSSGAAAGVNDFLTHPEHAEARGGMTIQEVINLFISSVEGSPFNDTVDTVKSGDPGQLVTGIVTTMFATIGVIRTAIEAGANLIIAHEPAFYNHRDDTQALSDDEVYRYKKALLDKHNVVIWRCHDYIHSHKPDGVYEGVLAKLGWSQYAGADGPYRLAIPATSLQSIITLTKKSLGIPMLRYMGDPASKCRTVTLLVGAAGGPRQIRAIHDTKPDLVMIGELVEWETMEYMRDLRLSGGKTSLIIMGHIPSEEPGMEWMAGWLKKKISNVPVTFVPSGTPVKWG